MAVPKAEQSGAETPACVGDAPVSKLKIAVGVVAVVALAGAYWNLSDSGSLQTLSDEDGLRREVERLGSWGPLLLIAIMTAAIVMSPIPSGPIAMVAGAAYGPLWGTIYVVVGAELGAVVAFWIARCLGYEFVRRWLKGHLAFLTRPRSQPMLMAIVFASRLVPFISFDAVSYVAGLTPLAFWRFAVATLAGVIPVSILLTYFGERLLSAESGRLAVVVVLVGGVTLLPIAGKLFWSWRRKRRDGRPD